MSLLQFSGQNYAEILLFTGAKNIALKFRTEISINFLQGD